MRSYHSIEELIFPNPIRQYFSSSIYEHYHRSDYPNDRNRKIDYIVGHFEILDDEILRENLNSHKLSTDSYFLMQISSPTISYDIKRSDDEKKMIFTRYYDPKILPRFLIDEILYCLYGYVDKHKPCKNFLRVHIDQEDQEDQEDNPILIVRCRMNHPNLSLMSFPSYFEEIHHYMRMTRQESGNIDVYGILTTLDEWIFFWFESSSEIVQMRKLPTEKTGKFNPKEKILNSNAMKITQVDFFKTLTSFLLRGLNSRQSTEKMSILSSFGYTNHLRNNSDNELIFTADYLQSFPRSPRFFFQNFQKEIFIQETFVEGFLKKRDFLSSFHSIKEFPKSNDGEAILMCYQSSPEDTCNFSLVVVKFMRGDKSSRKYTENEIAGWKCFGFDIGQIDRVMTYKSTTFAGEPFVNKYTITTLIIPFCFTLKNPHGMKKEFNFDFSGFCTNILPPEFSDEHKKLLEVASLEWQDENSAHRAIEEALRVMWDKNILDHGSVKWKHIGLLPYLKQEQDPTETFTRTEQQGQEGENLSGTKLYLKPVLIDFSKSRPLKREDYDNDFEVYKNRKMVDFLY